MVKANIVLDFCFLRLASAAEVAHHFANHPRIASGEEALPARGEFPHNGRGGVLFQFCFKCGQVRALGCKGEEVTVRLELLDAKGELAEE